MAGNRWGVSTNQVIDWHNDGPVANIKIEHSLNGGTDWVNPAIANSEPVANGQKSWSIPNTTSANVVVRISDVITDSGTDSVVSGVFKIVGSSTFSAPVGTTVWPVTSGEIANTTQNIVWSTQGNIVQVNLWYCSYSKTMFRVPRTAYRLP